MAAASCREPEARSHPRIAEHALDPRPERHGIARRHEQPGDAVHDGIAKAADIGCDHWAGDPMASRATMPFPSRRDGTHTAARSSTARPDRGERTRSPLGRGRAAAVSTTTLGSPSVAARNSRIPFSGLRRPRNRTCGGSSGSATSAGMSTPFGMTCTSRAPSRPAACPRKADAATTLRARPIRASRGAAPSPQARHRCPRPEARRACESRAREAPRGSSERGQRPPPSRRAGRPRRTRR